MKILVTGNCQARPLGQLLAQHTDHEVLDPIILHLSDDTQRAAHAERIAQADLVLAQATAAVFEPSHLRSDVLRDTRPGQVLVWPNIFFTGQHPYLRYMTHNRDGRIIGPMEATHDMRIVNAWFEDRRGAPFSTAITQAGYEDTVQAASLRDLRAREQTCDVTISDLIEAHFETQRLFFTFNHPSRWLLTRLCERLLDTMGQGQRLPAEGREPLSQYQPPWRFGPDAPLQGRQVDTSVPGKVTLGPVRPYTYAQYQTAAFACYDHMAHLMVPDDIRVTPRY